MVAGVAVPPDAILTPNRRRTGSALGRRHQAHPDAERVSPSGGRGGRFQPPRGRLGDARVSAHRIGPASTEHGDWATPPAGVIHHSDQGSQYTSIAFGRRCREAGVRPSMGSRGDCYDNALFEAYSPRRSGVVEAPYVHESGRGAAVDLQVHRGLVQPTSTSFRARLRYATGLRMEADGWASDRGHRRKDQDVKPSTVC